VSPFVGGHDGRDGGNGDGPPWRGHPSSRDRAVGGHLPFYAAGIAETVHLDTGDVRIFARRASHATLAKAREVTPPEAVHRYPTLAKECRLAPRPTRCAVVLIRCCVPRLSKSARSQTDRT
jgi:hypothetical protein